MTVSQRWNTFRKSSGVGQVRSSGEKCRISNCAGSSEITRSLQEAVLPPFACLPGIRRSHKEGGCASIYWRVFGGSGAQQAWATCARTGRTLVAIRSLDNSADEVAVAQSRERGHDILNRGFGFRAALSLAFADISPIVALYAIFALGLFAAGPRFFWAFPIVLCGQLLVALGCTELASRFPYAGSVYQWARHAKGTTWGWTAAWAYIWGLTLTCVVALPPRQSDLDIVRRAARQFGQHHEHDAHRRCVRGLGIPGLRIRRLDRRRGGKPRTQRTQGHCLRPASRGRAWPCSRQCRVRSTGWRAIAPFPVPSSSRNSLAQNACRSAPSA